MKAAPAGTARGSGGQVLDIEFIRHKTATAVRVSWRFVPDEFAPARRICAPCQVLSGAMYCTASSRMRVYESGASVHGYW